MSDEPQPRAEWIFPEQKKSTKGRVWLIVGLIVLVIAIVGALLFFLLPRGGGPEPIPSPTTTDTTDPTPPPTALPRPTMVPTTEPTPEPQLTPPPVPDPDVATFTNQVQPRLDDASRGLTIAAESSSQDAALVVGTLQGDAGRLSDAAAPSSISSAWYAAVGQYSARLGELRGAIEAGSDTQSAMDAATAALRELRAIVGL